MKKLDNIDYQTLTDQQLLDIYECTVNKQPESQYVEKFLQNFDSDFALPMVPVHICTEIARRWVNDMRQK